MLLAAVTPAGAPVVTRWQLASELMADVRQLEQRIAEVEARINALYMMGMVQVRRPSAGQAYYRRKLAEGKSLKKALRCLKRWLSDAVYRCLVTDQRRNPEATAPA